MPRKAKLPICKGKNELLKQVTYVAMIPDSVDLQGDFTSADEVRKAMESFNRSHQTANLFHILKTDTFEVVESYLAPVDFNLSGKDVLKGTWLMTLQVKDDKVWQMIENGEINGISIGASAEITELEEDNDNN